MLSLRVSFLMLLNFVQAHLDLSQADRLKCYVPILLYSLNSHMAFCVCTLRFKICKIIKYCGTPTPVLGGLIYSLLHLAWRCCTVSPLMRILKAGMGTRDGAVRQLIGWQFKQPTIGGSHRAKQNWKTNQQVSSLISLFIEAHFVNPIQFFCFLNILILLSGLSLVTTDLNGDTGKNLSFSHNRFYLVLQRGDCKSKFLIIHVLYSSVSYDRGSH